MVSVKLVSKTLSSTNNGVFVSRRYLVLAVLVVVFMLYQQAKDVLHDNHHRIQETDDVVPPRTVYVESKPVLRNPKDLNRCRFYLAESAVAKGAGLGIFTAVGLMKGDTVAFPDVCIFVSDAPKKWTHLRSHSYGCEYFVQTARSSPQSYHAPCLTQSQNTRINQGVLTLASLKEAILELLVRVSQHKSIRCPAHT